MVCTGCYPFEDDDPLLVKDCPHIYIAGNQTQFASRKIVGPADQEVLLIAVPKFSQSKSIVLVDMETLEVELVQFDVVGAGA
jgi:DNA polymerase delta subunit 2